MKFKSEDDMARNHGALGQQTFCSVTFLIAITVTDGFPRLRNLLDTTLDNADWIGSSALPPLYMEGSKPSSLRCNR